MKDIHIATCEALTGADYLRFTLLGWKKQKHRRGLPNQPRKCCWMPGICIFGLRLTVKASAVLSKKNIFLGISRMPPRYLILLIIYRLESIRMQPLAPLKQRFWMLWAKVRIDPFSNISTPLLGPKKFDTAPQFH